MRRHYTQRSEYCSKEYFEIEKIPELKKLIQNADTDTRLINSLSRWLSLKQKAEERWPKVFETALNEGSLNWRKLAEYYDCERAPFTNAFDRKVKVAMEPYGIAISAQKFILTVVNYYKRLHDVATSENKTEDSSENSDSDEPDKESSEETFEKGNELPEDSSKTDVSGKAEEIGKTTFEKPIPKMKCMEGIEPFEKALKKMNSELTTDEKVLYILNIMGLSSMKKEKGKIIFENCKYMVTYKMPSSFKDIIFKEMYERCFLPETIMILSTFINNYVQKYGNKRNIKAFDFLNELYDVVIL